MASGRARRAAPVVRIGALVAMSLVATAAVAREVTFPKDEPKITMDVPDGWDVTYSAFGLEIVSPEKNLYIVADLLPRKKSEADAWAIKAESKLETFGVVFATARSAPASIKRAAPVEAEREAAKPDAAKGDVTKPDATKLDATKGDVAKPETGAANAMAVQPDAKPSGRAQAQPGVAFASSIKPDLSNAPTFTFMNPPEKIVEAPAPPPPPAAAYFGPPTLDTPDQPEAPTSVRTDVPRAASMAELLKPPVVRPSIPFAVGRLPSATRDGKPIDVEIVNYMVSPRQLFLMLQASGPTDNRAVDIIKSVKPAR